MLRKRGQRLLKMFHLMFAGVWLGALAALVFLQIGPPARSEMRFAADLALFRLHEEVLFLAFVGTLVTGTTFSLFTQWGFFKFRWVTTKWALSLVLFSITLFWQSPALSGTVALSDAGIDEIAGFRYLDFRSTTLRLAVVQLSIVLIVFGISTLKPWGRNRREFALSRKLQIALASGLAAVGLAAALAGYANLKRYRAMAIADLDAVGVPDGVYTGAANCGFDYLVEITVSNERIHDLRTLRNRDSHYAVIAEAVLPRIVSHQNANVDGITGATTTSKCLMRAVEDGLRGAVESGGRTIEKRRIP